ncbi:M20/M25/M40 family metallo-hydrolase [Fructobacillus ficulneus]|uniref:Peptidase, ArgE/DapE family n=1 Tax=Fructobacillus ficulneus TaxID=157463 RepID=A0A0K8MH93_9LACO|nr:M20/M25/M40 family metallo-hydrolase [Fructobacillus ficulneus]GAO99905.1 peptidase, ArgE/DapE family [Fructobacillus ficulneus]
MDFDQSKDLLKDLIAIETVGGNEGEMASYLAEFLTANGIKNQIFELKPGRYNLVAEIGDQPSPVLVFEGHQDVVSLVDPDQWTHAPFGSEIVGKKLYGRGSSDMKGGLAAEITAIVNLKESGQPINGTIRLLVTVGEESSRYDHMQGAQYFADNGYLDDVTAMIVGEPSSLPLDWLNSEAKSKPFSLTAFERASLMAANHNSEQFMVNFSHRGSVTYEVRATGKAAHSSTPELGINAIDSLMQFYNAQEEYFQTFSAVDPVLGPTTPVVTKITGGNQLNSVPATASVFGKIRTIPAESNQDIEADLRALVDRVNQETEADLAFHLIGSKMPVSGSADNPLMQNLQRLGEEYLHQTVPLGGMKAETDGSEYFKRNPDLAIAVFGPGNMTAHQIDEYLDLDNFAAFIQIYEEAARDFFAPTGIVESDQGPAAVNNAGSLG